MKVRPQTSPTTALPDAMSLPDSIRACKLSGEQLSDFLRVDIKRGLSHDEVHTIRNNVYVCCVCWATRDAER